MSIEFVTYLILFFLGIVFYFNHKPAQVLVCLTAIGCGFFRIFSTDDCVALVHPYDLMLFLSLIITTFESTKQQGYFSCKDDSIGKMILIVLIYTSLVCVVSIAVGLESWSFALKVYRVNLILLLYFYYRGESPKYAKRFFDIMLVFSTIQGILCYLQLFDIHLLEVSSSETDGVTRYAGYPTLSMLFVLMAMIDDRMNAGKRVFLFLFFGGTILLSMTRGPILTIITAYGIYILASRRVKNLFFLGIFALVYLIAVAPIMERRNNERSSASDELKTIIENPLATHESFNGSSGTALYRIACVTERFAYMLDNPKYLPFGVGTVHENSPMNRYNVFITGLNNEQLVYQKETVSSADITWVNVLMRYGLIGVILFVMMYVIAAKVGIPHIRHSKEAIFIMAASLPLANLFGSLGTNNFDIAPRFLDFLLPLMIIGAYLNNKQIPNVVKKIKK